MTAEPFYADSAVTLHHGDCLDVLRTLPDASVDAVVTDPPYALNFMGRSWDSFRGWTSGACEECGNDDPCEGWLLCSDCLEDLTDADGSPMAGHYAQNAREKGAHTRGYADSNNAAFQRWCTQWARECLRVLKPGGHILAFGGSRTWHRLACAIEDAGFEIRDSVAWLYASGFPKSLDVSEAMQSFVDHGPLEVTNPDPAIRPGVYEVTGFLRAARDAAGWTNRQLDDLFGTNGMSGHWVSRGSQPAVPSVRQWAVLKEALGFDDSMDELVAELASTERPEDWGSSPGQQGPFLGTLQRNTDAPPAGGWGTALKPSFEPIVVGRKPIAAGTVAANIKTYGTGALNIDGCRTEMSREDRENFERGAEAWREHSERHGGTRADGTGRKATEIYGTYGIAANGPHNGGRWPANTILDEHMADELDRQSGEGKSTSGGVAGWQDEYVGGTYKPIDRTGYDDRGGASRFFYVAKANRSERVKVDGIAHPTVKPLTIMRWLVRLVTPPGGTVLEPFAGSGTTVEACLLEGFHCVAIERETDYLPLIRQRLNRRRDPVAAVRAAGVDDLGLFGLLDDDDNQPTTSEGVA